VATIDVRVSAVGRVFTRAAYKLSRAVAVAVMLAIVGKLVDDTQGHKMKTVSKSTIHIVWI
jgi:hypothetical protein